MRDTFFIPEHVDLPKLLDAPQLSGFNKPQRIAKSYYVIDHLYIGAILREQGGEEFLPLNSNVLREILGTRDASMVKNLLRRLGIIEVRKRNGRETYQAKSGSKEYRFCRPYWDVPFRAVPSGYPRFTTKLQRWKEKSSAFTAKRQTGSQLIYNSCLNLEYDFNRAKTLISSTAFEKLSQNHWWIHSVDMIADKSWRFIRDAQGRLYHAISNLPRPLRQFTTFKGKPLIAADISCSHFCLLVVLYETDCEERTRYINLVESGCLYEFLNKRLVSPYDFTSADAYADFKREVFHRLLYSSIYGEPSELWIIFEQEFPILGKLVRNAKKRHQRDLSKRLQTLEAQIVVERVANEFARKYSQVSPCLLSLHDSLVSTEEYVPELREMLAREFEETIGFRPKIKRKQFNEAPVNKQHHEVTSFRDVVQGANGRSSKAA